MYENMPEPRQNAFLCKKHIIHKNEKLLSPCRGKKCKQCKKQKVGGFTNPRHVCNPFGYLYLFPLICENCAIKYELCAWCR
jgi:hypothetical protein